MIVLPALLGNGQTRRKRQKEAAMFFYACSLKLRT
jgi:hypothetical protein